MIPSAHERQAALEDAILALEALLERSNVPEDCFQHYFEAHKVAFDVLGYAKALAFTRESGRPLPRDPDGAKPEPDFLAQRSIDGLCEIVEIKRADPDDLVTSVRGRRERFRAEIESYIAQLYEYNKYFNSTEIRQFVRNTYDLPVNENLDCKLIIGRAKWLDREKIHEQSRRRNIKIDILTYDDILQQLNESYSEQFGFVEGAPGFAIHLLIRLHDNRDRTPGYIVDYGKRDNKNRVVLYMDPCNIIRFKIFDKFGVAHELSFDAQSSRIIDQWAFLACEFGRMPQWSCMRLYIDTTKQEHRIGTTAIDIEFAKHNGYLGCNRNKRCFAKMDIGLKLVYGGIMPFRKRRRMADLLRQLEYPRKFMEFDGSKYMRIVQRKLVQKIHRFQPRMGTHRSAAEEEKSV